MEKKLFLSGGVLFFLVAILQILARFMDGFGEWYGTSIYPLLVGSISRFFSLFPVSMVEIFLYLLIIILLVYLVCLVRAIMKRRQTLFNALIHCVARFWFLVTLLLFLYTITCGINYYRVPFSTVSGFHLVASDSDDLIELCSYLKEQVNLAAEGIATDEKGLSVLPEGVGEEAKAAMSKLGEQYPVLSGYYPLPKGLIISKVLSVQQLSGIYSPFTIEANYNKEMPSYNIPVTACHELSHLKGFMREEEANFIAYLACEESGIKEFNYSGALLAFIYSSNALYDSGDIEQYWKLYDELCNTAKLDLEANQLYWKQYEGKVAEAANQMNDVYLKVNSQSDGVKSYGRMVDLLLANYKQNIKSQSGQ